ncbi:MAG: glycogen/starch synthase, partial [Bacteroidales bacterium]|nr:glycogen/starch synthase [Bacteroidales bacterium]
TMKSDIKTTVKEKYKEKKNQKNPRILIITPEITYLPKGMGNMANVLAAKAGGMADVSASLVSELYELGADIHVALPHYRRMFNIDIGQFISEELRIFQEKLPDSRIHLAEDRIFYYRDSIYSGYGAEAANISLAFQREVINNIIPTVKPDLIHCNDWMTSLIPAMARRRGIPCLFTIHNIHTQKYFLSQIEDRGIDAAEFWQHLFFQWPPASYEESRENNPVDLLSSGIFASHFINTVSPTFLREITEGQHGFIPEQIRGEISNKMDTGCAFGIINAPDKIYDPETNPNVIYNYSWEEPLKWKKKNKLELQRKLGLIEDENAPLLFWPSRLDPVQKGCDLLAHILYKVIASHWDSHLQIVFVANGSDQQVFREIVHFHNFYDRVSVCDFDEELSHLAYAASDFVLMPSKFEPCGLPQMIGSIFGSLPIAFDTGGLHDTVEHLNSDENTGNGFLFKVFDGPGLEWAINQAMKFYTLPADRKEQQISRIMKEGSERFNLSETAKNYIRLYEQMLHRPLVV